MFRYIKESVLVIILGLSLITLQAQPNRKIYNLVDYGIVPNTGEDYSVLINEAIEKIVQQNRPNAGLIIKFKKGRYDFFPEKAVKKTYFISNHDQDNPKSVGIALEHIDNLTIDGQGADFFFHGRMLPISLIENKNITLKNINIDFQQPQICQVEILSNDVDNGIVTFKTAPWVTYDIKDSVFYNTGRGWSLNPTAGIVFEKDTKRIVYNTSDIAVGTKKVEEISKGVLKSYNWKNSKLKPGMVIAMRTWQRPNPGIFLHKGKNVTLEEVTVHYSEGMGLLAQLSENIYLDGFNVSLRGEKDPRYFTAQADATHFSSCKGVIISKNGLYENMMDDAINIHGTYLKIIDRINDSTIVARYMHGQAYGFDWGFKGDSVQFIKSKTMDLIGTNNIIQSIEVLRENSDDPIKIFKIVFAEKLDPRVDPTITDLGIENLSWTPEVLFTKNIIRNNRARGALFSTPQKTVVSHNLFDHTSGTAVLLCGDCNGWYETGSTRDIVIRNNTFINALTNQFQFTNAVISIYPEIPDLKNQKTYFHSGIVIEDNKFETFDKPLVYAKSVDGLIFKGNKIKTNNDFPAFHWNTKELFFERVVNEVVTDNRIDGKKFKYQK